MEKNYDTYIVTIASDFRRLISQYGRLRKNMPAGKVIFVGSHELKEAMAELEEPEKYGFVSEEELLPIQEVWDVFNDHLKELLQGDTVPRGAVGWYYQQFLKYRLASVSENEYYMVWDGDTIPCRPVHMFSEDGIPYFNNKNEYHALYFTTMEKLIPGLHKVIRGSFISEHMLFQRDMVKKLIDRIEANEALKGSSFWEKIIRVIPPEKVSESAFSEFETYGTFVALNDPTMYRIREWHSFRLGGEFYHPDKMRDQDYAYLGKDFDAISFEKDHSIKPGNENIFTNPRYTEKLTARQMLEAIQMDANGGYMEDWSGTGVGSDPLA